MPYRTNVMNTNPSGSAFAALPMPRIATVYVPSHAFAASSKTFARITSLTGVAPPRSVKNIGGICAVRMGLPKPASVCISASTVRVMTAMESTSRKLKCPPAASTIQGRCAAPATDRDSGREWSPEEDHLCRRASQQPSRHSKFLVPKTAKFEIRDCKKY